jgi:DNA-binding NarL/FixJ family response regulator
MEKIRVMLIHHGELFREGLATILAREPKFDVVAKSNCGKDAIELVNQLQPDIILLDAADLGSSRPEMRRMRKLAPKVRFIILTLPWKHKVSFDIFEEGVSALISKDVDVDNVIRGIVLVHAGALVVFPPMSEECIKAFGHQVEETVKEKAEYDAELTEREKEVLSMSAQGKTNKEISEALSISEHTVKVYMSRILAKLHVRNRQQAAARTAGQPQRAKP